MKMEIEVLVIIDNKSSSLCRDKKGLISFINAHSKISVKSNKFYFEDDGIQQDINLLIRCGSMIKGERFFDLKLSDNESKEEVLKIAHRKITSIMSSIDNNNTTVIELWNDLTKNYAEKAYTKINDIENLMRKFIIKFMCVFYGRNWLDKKLVEEIKKKGDKLSRYQNLNHRVYDADFIELTDILLFKEYSDVSIDKLSKLIRENKDSIKTSELIQFTKRSNWNRFFNKFVEIEEEKLKKNWNKMYEFRNKVAHNRGLSKPEFEELIKLYEELKLDLSLALEAVEAIVLTSSQSDRITKLLENSFKKENSWEGILVTLGILFNPIEFSKYLEENESEIDE